MPRPFSGKTTALEVRRECFYLCFRGLKKARENIGLFLPHFSG
jgi:hypothetical protein